MQVLINDYEFELLQTLSDPIRAVQTMLLTKLLSAHAMDEVYLCDRNKWMLVCILLLAQILDTCKSHTWYCLPVLEYNPQQGSHLSLLLPVTE